ncbi:hypothetical protein FZEAL_3209 [Fusarium zealandicum]|uniref:Uncharacterized protein n=1 Tax=Fusarium zealandicum TaxID=1053134 RepID=A0A8H4UP85_9HYPO|nr:hypothetical protein FZEAL_3209 [Fusarium zealandicum]
MPKPKNKGPSHFCEWVVGTTIDSFLGPIPKQKLRKRDVVRVEVTTDDESEEDTVKITYPRTGRTTKSVTKAKTVVKKVRFDDAPKKSALKKNPATSTDSSEEETESSPEPVSDSSQSDNMSSSNASGSDAESSDESPKPTKKQRKKQVSDDTESDWDSDPDPTCKCRRCTKGREVLERIRKRSGNNDTATSTEASESDTDEPTKGKKQRSAKDKKKGDKKKGDKKNEEPETDTEASDSSKDASESEPEAPPKKQQPKKQGKAKQSKKKQSTPEAETSESEPEPPKAKKKQESSKSTQKKGAKKAEEPETEDEVSESAQETEEESEPEPKKKQTDKAKSKAENQKTDNKKQGKQEPKGKQEQKGNKKQNKGKQKAGKNAEQELEEPEELEDPKEPEDQAEDVEVGESSGQKDKGKSRKAKGKEKAAPKDTAPERPKFKDGVKKGNYPEGLPFSHPRRPQLIEPIRAEVVQTERVVETPEDPAPNAYYDPEHNVLRVYHGPVYGNHQNHALYPDRNAFNRPLPVGMPHPTQNPYFYGFNNPQQHPAYGLNTPYHPHYGHMPPPPEGYSHVPITQGMPGGGWGAPCGPPGFPPEPPVDGQEAKPSPGAVGKTDNPTPTSSKGKEKASQNNVGPSSQTGQDNPYLPKRAKSQFSAWGSRSASKGDDPSAGSAKAGSNNWDNTMANDTGDTWNNNNNAGDGWNNDGAGDNNQGDNQTGWNVPQDTNQYNTWGTTSNQNSATWGEQGEKTNWEANTSREVRDNGNTWASGSNKSNDTVRKKGDHWGTDTHLGGFNWDDKNEAPSTQGQGVDNNVVGWDVNAGSNGSHRSGGSKKDEVPSDNVMPGSWVDTPSYPSWGDPTAAVDTNGEAVNW